MACGPGEVSCERRGCVSSSRTGGAAPGSEVAPQEQSLTQEPEEPRCVCHRLQHHGAARWPGGSHSHTERGSAGIGVLGFGPWQRWNHSRATAPAAEPGGVTVGLGRGGGAGGAHSEGTRQAHGDREEREPSWELLPLAGGTTRHLRPGQANLRLRVPQKWYLGGVLNPELFHVGERRQHLFHLQGFQKCSVPSQECPGTSFLQDVMGSRLGLSQADTSLSELQGVKGTPAGLPLLLGALSTSPGTVKPSQEKAGRLLPAKRV